MTSAHARNGDRGVEVLAADAHARRARREAASLPRRRRERHAAARPGRQRLRHLHERRSAQGPLRRPRFHHGVRPHPHRRWCDASSAEGESLRFIVVNARHSRARCTGRASGLRVPRPRAASASSRSAPLRGCSPSRAVLCVSATGRSWTSVSTSLSAAARARAALPATLLKKIANATGAFAGRAEHVARERDRVVERARLRAHRAPRLHARGSAVQRAVDAADRELRDELGSDCRIAPGDAQQLRPCCAPWCGSRRRDRSRSSRRAPGRRADLARATRHGSGGVAGSCPVAPSLARRAS